MHDVIQRNMFGFFWFFLRTQTSLRSGSAARLASPSRPLGLLLRHIFLKTCLAITFSTLISCTENKDHRVGRWVTRRCDEHRDSNRAGKKTTWSFLFSYFDLLIWRPYLLCGSVHKPSPLLPLTEPAPFHSPQLHSSLVPPCPPPSLPSTLCQLEKSTMLEAWSVLACFAKAPPAFGHFEPLTLCPSSDSGIGVSWEPFAGTTLIVLSPIKSMNPWVVFCPPPLPPFREECKTL